MKTITRLAGTALAVVSLVVVMANPAGASHVTGWGIPSRSGELINAAVHGDKSCPYFQCEWHVSIERSSWNGFRTMDGSRRDLYFGSLQVACMEGEYDYKAHWHEERMVAEPKSVGVAGASYGYVSYSKRTLTQDSPGRRIRCERVPELPPVKVPELVLV